MSSAADIVPTIPDHEMLRRVGRGSYGEVWLARNVVGTFRAIKVVYRASFDSERPYEREFSGLQKFEPVSRTHPGLVSILHIGRNDQAGCFYCVMEVADDLAAGPAIDPQNYQPRTLAGELAKRGRLPVAESVELGVALTAALGHLHANGLVHRDLKPSNIIFVNGVPKLADIGLVTQIGASATFVGTEGYVPPEGPGSPSADLFALGRVLYEISMGKSQDEFPELPSALRDLPDAAGLMRLNGIVLKACDRQPAKRFRSAEELQAALVKLRSEIVGSGGLAGAQARGTAGSRIVILAATGNGSDEALARALREKLAAQGYVVWVDEQAALSVAWARRLEQEVRSADAVVALLSAASLNSDMMAYGLEIARQTAGRTKLKPLLVPVAIGVRRPFPRQIAVTLEEATAITVPDHEVAEIAPKVLAALQPRTVSLSPG